MLRKGNVLYNNMISDLETGGDVVSREYLCLLCYLCALPCPTGDFLTLNQGWQIYNKEFIYKSGKK